MAPSISIGWNPTVQELALFPEIKELYIKLGKLQVEFTEVQLEMAKLALQRQKERKGEDQS